MALDGDSEAQDAGKKLVELFGGKAFSVPAENVRPTMRQRVSAPTTL